jgi:hypothetical protein
MLIIFQFVNKQTFKNMKNLFYSLVIVLGLTSCGGSIEPTTSTDSTSVDTTQVDTCCVDTCNVDSCKKDSVK